MSSEPYYLSGPGINQNWDWNHGRQARRADRGGTRGEETASGYSAGSLGRNAKESAPAGVLGKRMV